MTNIIQFTDLQAALFWNSAILLGLILSLIVQWREVKRLRLDYLSSFLMIAAFNTALIIGTRLGTIDLNGWQLLFQEGIVPVPHGKTLIGGFLLALLVYLIFKKYWKLNGAHADLIFIALPIAAAVSRLGCAAAGCCYGNITDSGFAWAYGPGMPAYEWQLDQGFISSTASESLPVYPVQLLFSISNIVLFTFLWNIRKKLKVAGSLALLTITLMLFNRFGMEFLREAVTDRGVFGNLALGLKTAQWLALSGGILAIIFLWRNESRKSIKGSLAKPIPFLGTTLTLLGIASIIYAFSHLLSLDEQLFLVLSSIPAVGFLVKRLWLDWSVLSYRFTNTSMLSLASLLLLMSPLDTIPPMAQGEHWINIGVGTTGGSFDNVVKDCDGKTIRDERITFASSAFDASYHYQFAEKGSIGAGVHGSFGKLSSDDPPSQFNYTSSAVGPYLTLNLKLLGLQRGALIIRRHPLSSGTASYFQAKETIQSWYVRLGALHKYYVDVGRYDRPGILFHPEPALTIGLVNWGFNDRSGASNIRLGYASIDYQGAFLLSGKVPLGRTGLNAGGAFYIGDRPAFSLMLQYRQRIAKRKTPSADF